MKILIFATLLIFVCTSATAQDSTYSQLTNAALHTMWDAEDSVGNRNALNMYERAFRLYPDSIDNLGRYKASVLAGELHELNKAFAYLQAFWTKEKDGWDYIVGHAASSEYKNLLSDPRWKELEKQAAAKKEEFFNHLQTAQTEFFQTQTVSFDTVVIGMALYRQLQNTNGYTNKKSRDYSISFTINDSAKTAYFVHLPQHYNPEKKYALLFFLHGAVRNNGLAEYRMAEEVLEGWNRYYTKYADSDDVILVFPKGSRQYNWMAPEDGFDMVPRMLTEIKKAINVNDDKVFISGHSNGATGSFSYYMKYPTPFAGFYGFNTYPKVFTGGTFIQNGLNRSFINFSTDQDYYYPPNANDRLDSLMKVLGADYKDYRYNGFPHWFPQFDESEPAYQILFDDIKHRQRNPFPDSIYWQLDDVKNGRIDWIQVTGLDTAADKKSWQTRPNFTIYKWLEYDKQDSLQAKKVNRSAFDFPRKSGIIKAGYQNNTFRIETSCIKSFTLFLSPGMVDVKKKIKVYVNSKLYFDDIVSFDKKFLLKNFEENRDRDQLWINCIEIKL